MKKVLIFGTFDGLHSGHLDFFKQAKNYGNHLVVVVARDETVKKLKKHPPFLNEEKRLKIVQNCQLVGEARLGYNDSPYRVIEELNPDVICLGYDQKAFTKNLPKELKKMKLTTKSFRMKPYQPEKCHSSLLRVVNYKI